MEYSYEPSNWLSIVKTFASFTGIPLDENGVLHLPSTLATGIVRAASPDDGFSYLIIKGKVNESITLQRMSPVDGDSFSMFLLEVTPANALTIIDTDKKVYAGLDTVQTIFFSATSNSRSVIFSKDAVVNMISIHFTRDWLKKQFSPSLQEIVEKRAHTKVSVQLTNIIQNDLSQLMKEIFNMEKYHPLFIQSQQVSIFSLADSFFRSLERGDYLY